MSARSGPRLAGIGRSGGSDIVMCMDAHDAGSYGGEATVNLFPQPSLASSAVGSTWSGANGTWGTSTATVESVMGPDGKYIKAIANQHTASGGGTAHIWFFYHYLSGMGGAQTDLTLTNGTFYTCSWWWKAVNSRSANSNSIYFTGAQNYSTAHVNPVTTEWTRVFCDFTFGGITGTYRPGHYFYSCGDDFKVWYAMLQIEEKTYSTPAVRSQLSGFSQQGYNARPASVDLMIHGNVGTGTTFKDSSPRKLALTNTNGVSHADTSKFGGSALKFVRSSTQWIETASTDAANFGTGDWTIDYWFNMTSGQTNRMHALDLGVYASSNISLNFNDGNAFWLYWNGSGGNNIIWGSDGDYGDGAWHHMAVTRRLGMIRVWVDGVHKGSNNYSSSTSMGTTTNIDIGASGGGVLWDGYLDEIRITKGTALWYGGISGTGNFTPPTRRSNDGPVVDLSGHNNAGNFATTDSTDVKTNRRGQVIEPIANAIWNFDGTDDYLLSGDINAGNGTLELWMKTTFSGVHSYPFGKQKGTETLAMAMHAANSPAHSGNFWVRDTGGASGSVNTTAALNDGVWHQVVAMWGSAGLKIYVDGEFNDGDTNFTGDGFASSGDAPLGIGCILNGSYVASYLTPMQGAIARLWSIQLTSEQVKQNFNNFRGRFGV